VGSVEVQEVKLPVNAGQMAPKNFRFAQVRTCSHRCAKNQKYPNLEPELGFGSGPVQVWHRFGTEQRQH
jgi:hypothetical protein